MSAVANSVVPDFKTLIMLRNALRPPVPWLCRSLAPDPSTIW
jgi:hypothetical protein